jgi:hypothetical protein
MDQDAYDPQSSGPSSTWHAQSLFFDSVCFVPNVHGASASEACFLVTSPNVSYRSAFFFEPLGAISVSRQRIAHPFLRFSKHPLPY